MRLPNAVASRSGLQPRKLNGFTVREKVIVFRTGCHDFKSLDRHRGYESLASDCRVDTCGIERTRRGPVETDNRSEARLLAWQIVAAARCRTRRWRIGERSARSMASLVPLLCATVCTRGGSAYPACRNNRLHSTSYRPSKTLSANGVAPPFSVWMS